MASQFTNTRQGTGVTDLASRLRKDVTWGRLLFQPPALTNPHVVFDPMPFRTHEFAPARAKKSAGSR